MERFSRNNVTNICHKYIKMFEALEAQVSTNLQAAGVETRLTHTNGSWCCTLLPIILLLYTYLDEVTLLYKLIAFISVGMCAYCLLLILFLSTSSTVIREANYNGCVSAGLISTLLIYILLHQGFLVSLSISVPSIYLFSWLLRISLMKFQKTFTIGEAMIVCQAISLSIVSAGLKYSLGLYSDDKEMEFVNIIIYTVLFTVASVAGALSLLRDHQRNIKYLILILVLAASLVLGVLRGALGSNYITDILDYVFGRHQRVQLIKFWLILVIIAICVLSVRTKLATKADTVARKTFHVLASLVFLSGIILDEYLFILAAGIAFGVLVFLEALRKSKIEPISSALQAVFLVYCDEKDCGAFAMTPLYLLLGLSLPLPLARAPLERAAGVLAVGVGDTAASWFGSRFGFNKWNCSNRTMEGTLFNILSQIGTVYALQLFKLINVNHAIIRTTVAATVSGLVEAKIDQVDNLVLPLVTLIAFQATWPLR